MVLVFGGTTEGREVIHLLNKMKIDFLYSTKSLFKINTGHYGTHIHGSMDSEKIKSLIKSKNIEYVIDAGHPFANNLHNNVLALSCLKDVGLIRVNRTPSKISPHPLVIIVENFEEAINRLNKLNTSVLLALTGVQSIPKLQSFWTRNNTFFRILNKPSSLELAISKGVKKENLVLDKIGQNFSDELNLIKSVGAKMVLTKDSGFIGGLDHKIRACKEVNIPILIIKRPEVIGYKNVITNLDELALLLINGRKK